MHEGLREVAHRFLDAVEAGDLDCVREIYSPDLRFWINLTDTESSAEENIAAQLAGKSRVRRKLYNDRTVDVFDRGFLARYTVQITTLEGREIALSACIVALCDLDGRIVRVDEYLDGGKLPSWAQSKAG